MTIKKINKLITLIELLQHEPAYSRDEILDILNIEHATFYRYVRYLRHKGLHIRNSYKEVKITGGLQKLNISEMRSVLNCLSGFFDTIKYCY